MFKKFSQEILAPQNGLGLSSIELKEIQDTFTDQDLNILSKINELTTSYSNKDVIQSLASSLRQFPDKSQKDHFAKNQNTIGEELNKKVELFENQLSPKAKILFKMYKARTLQMIKSQIQNLKSK